MSVHIDVNNWIYLADMGPFAFFKQNPVLIDIFDDVLSDEKQNR